jgi:hypothetical protein
MNSAVTFPVARGLWLSALKWREGRRSRNCAVARSRACSQIQRVATKT